MAQSILVLDAASGEPIEGAALFNQEKTKSSLTDENGSASLLAFFENERIYTWSVSPVRCIYLGKMG